MHSKLIRLQTALLMLALLFTVLIPVSAYAEGETAAAQATADGTTSSDPNTFDAWVYTQAYNNATTGRIWADKTVEDEEIDLPGHDPIAVPKDDKDADFLVALSALSSYASTTTTNTQALDIVMVLDASGSMDETMSGGTTRMAALKSAVNAFIDNAKTQNEKIADKDKKIKLSIVNFPAKQRTESAMIPTATYGGAHTTTRRSYRGLPYVITPVPLRSKLRSVVLDLPVPHRRTMACCKPKKRWNLRAAMPKRLSSSLPMVHLPRNPILSLR